MLGSASTPVEVMNVADPISDSDAVNYATLKSTADELRTELGAGGLKYVQVNSTGADAVAAGSDAIAIGQQAVASSDSTVAVGAGARAAAAQAVALGNGSLADAALTVSVGNSTTALQRRVVNLQAGINADHAVSVSQLQPIITALGGGAAIDPATGAVTGPTYTLTNGGNQTTVAAALSQLDAAISAGGGGGGNPYLAVNSAGTAALASGADAIGLGSSTTASANSSVAIGAGSVANVANTVSVGSASNQRKLVNVAAGDISVATSTDAVNGGQLFAVAQDVDALQDALTGSGLIDPVSKTSLAVTYSSSAQTIVMLGNAGAIAKPAASRAADAAPPVWRSRRTVR
jgi:autotransporter adhesin